MTTAGIGLVVSFPTADGALEEHAARLHHRLTDCGMFDDKNLLRIIDSHPRTFIDVRGDGRVEFDSHEPPTDRAERKRASAALLDAALDGPAASQPSRDAAGSGRISIVIRDAMRFQPGLQRLTERLYCELHDRSPGFETQRLSADLILSHAATGIDELYRETPGIVWQVRGRQRVRISAGEGGAADAVFDLQPGDAVAHPLNSRQRVEALDGLCVTFATGHYTPRQFRRARVQRANRLLRDLRLPCRSTRTSGLSYMVKSTMDFGWQALQRLRPRLANR